MAKSYIDKRALRNEARKRRSRRHFVRSLFWPILAIPSFFSRDDAATDYWHLTGALFGAWIALIVSCIATIVSAFEGIGWAELALFTAITYLVGAWLALERSQYES